MAAARNQSHTGPPLHCPIPLTTVSTVEKGQAQTAAPDRRERPSGRRRSWLRDRPIIWWLTIAAVMTLIHPFVAESRWIMVHLITLGVLTHSVMVWSLHFTTALLHTRADFEPASNIDRRLGLLQVGVVMVLVGVPTTWWWLTVAGAVLVSGAVLLHGWALLRRLRAALPGRFRVTVRHYVAAAIALPVGAVFGAALAWGLPDPWHGRLLMAHTTTMLLGFVGLTALSTLVTLWPTMLRTRMAPQAERLSVRAFPLLVAGVVVLVTGALSGLRAVAVLGLVIYLAGVVVTGTAMVRTGIRKPPVSFPALSAAAAMCWFVAALTLLGVRMWSYDTFGELAGNYGVVTAMFVVGFGLQLVLAALTYLLPSVLGGGPRVMRAGMARIEKWGIWRFTVTNAGLLVCLLPVPSWVRVVVSVLVMIALALFVPFMLAGVKAGVRAKREAMTAPAGTRATVPNSHTTTRDDEAARVPTFSRAQVLTGAATVALGIGAGVAVDPAAAGVARGRGGGAAGITPTGRTTRVEVHSIDMRFVPDRAEVAPGDTLVIDLINDDATEVHDLVLDDGSSTGRIPPGRRASLQVDVVEADMEGWCSVVGHRQMGMVFAVATGQAAPSADHAASHATHATDESPRVDNRAVPSDDFVAHDAALPPLPPATGPATHAQTLTVREQVREVAPGIRAERWMFEGTAPGPSLRGRVGDRFEIHLVNNGSMGHSIDFHAGRTPTDSAMRTIPPGESLDYAFTAERAGAWMYHCSTAPMSTHIAAGMHGVVVIEPDGLPAADREWALVQSEIFLGAQDGPTNTDKVGAETPDLVVFNGYAWQYLHRPLQARVGERVRIWLLNAGPNRDSAFHVVGGQFHTVYKEGAYLLRDGAAPGEREPGHGGSQTVHLAASQGGFVEMTFAEPGRYTMVTHRMVDAERGAQGYIQVSA